MHGATAAPGRIARVGTAAVDTLAALLLAVPAGLGGLARLAFAKARSASRPGSEDGHRPRLLTLEGDYTLHTIRSRKLEHLVTCRDLDGFFEHVWSVHPAVGASRDEPREFSAGPPGSTSITPEHTMIEGRVARYPSLTGLPVFNFVAAQCALLVRLDRVIRRERVDVVRASDPLYLGLLGLTLARWNGIPLVVRLIANYDSDFYAVGRPAYPRLFKRRWVEKRVDRFVLAGADLVAAGNADLLQYALVNGASEDRSTVFLVGGAIDPIHFETEPSERASVREELGLGDRPFLVLVSRLELPKHPEDVIAVLGDVRRQVPDMVAVFVGDGSMRTQLEKMAAELGLRDAVVFAGDRDQPWIASALTSATVVVSPLTGRALVEGALSGTPIVAYDVDWHSEMVRSGETGLLVPYRDTGAMAEKVCELVRDPAYAAGLADRARRETAELMNPAALAEHERQQYVRLLADARGGRRRT